MSTTTPIKIVISGDEKDANRAIDSVDNHIGGFLGGSITKIGGVIAGAFAVDKVKDFLKESYGEAIEAQKATAATEQAIKSTGGAAQVSAGHIGDYATKLSNLTGIDDEVIQGGSNMLLTFTNIKNSVGAGNDIFDQATHAAVEMSKTFGGDVSSSAVQLGKALNDPAQGLSKLQKIGVTFTDQQKKQIETMQKAGDIAGAQKVILEELAKETGGQAEAQATAGERLTVTIGNIKEAVGTALLPVIDKVANFLSDNLPKAFDLTGKAIGPVKDVVGELKGGFDDLFGGIAHGTDALGSSQSVWAAAGATIAGFWYQTVKPALDEFVSFGRAKFTEISTFVSQIMPQIQEAIGHVLNVIELLWHTFGDNIWTNIQNVFNFIKEFISASLEIVKGVISTVLALINGDWGKAWDGIKQILGGVWDAMFAIVRLALETMKNLLSIGWDAIKLVASTAWAAFKAVISGALDGVIALLKAFPNSTVQALGSLLETLKSHGSDLITGLKIGVELATGDFTGVIKNIPKKVLDAAGSFGSILLEAGKDILRSLINGIESMVPSLISELGKVTKLIPAWKGPIEKDRVLLAPAGQAIMGGLIDNIESQRPALMSTLADVTGDITLGSFNPANAAASSAAGGSSAPNINIELHIMAPLDRAVTAADIKDAVSEAIRELEFEHG